MAALSSTSSSSSGYVVLSLFDGISCGRLALQRAGIPVKKYYASEKSKEINPKTGKFKRTHGYYAECIARYNHGNTIFVGDIESVTPGMFDEKIDIIIGGSPCQGFSAHGKRETFKHKESRLISDFFRLIQLLQPTYFLLENVGMHWGDYQTISYFMGVEPIAIDSQLLTAQHRERFYWTNIPNVQLPENKNMKAKDILEPELTWENASLASGRGKGYYYPSVAKNNEKKYAIGTSWQIGGLSKGYKSDIRVFSPLGKTMTLNTHYAPFIATLGYQTLVLTDAQRQRYEEHERFILSTHRTRKQMGKSGKNENNFFTFLNVPDPNGINGVKWIDKNNPLEVLPNYDDVEHRWRRMSFVECERLQTLPDNYTEFGRATLDGPKFPISRRERIRGIGNGWTVDVVAHIFKNMETAKPNAINNKFDLNQDATQVLRVANFYGEIEEEYKNKHKLQPIHLWCGILPPKEVLQKSVPAAPAPALKGDQEFSQTFLDLQRRMQDMQREVDRMLQSQKLESQQKAAAVNGKRKMMLKQLLAKFGHLRL